MDQLKQMRDYRTSFPAASIDYDGQQGAGRAVMWAMMSGKGGVGKSILAGIFALELARMGYRTLFVDTDFSLPDAQLLFDTANFVDPNAFIGRESASNEKLASGIDNLDVFIMQPQSEPANPNALRCLDSLMQNLAISYDFVLFDATTGFSEMHRRLCRTLDLVSVVSMPDPASITNAYALVKMIKMLFPQLHINVAMNRTQSRQDAIEAFAKLNLIVEHFLHFEAPLLCHIREEKKIKEKIQESLPLQFWPQNLTVFQSVQQILAQLAPQLRPDPHILQNSAKAIA